jgi:hypothetical protein
MTSHRVVATCALCDDGFSRSQQGAPEKELG